MGCQVGCRHVLVAMPGGQRALEAAQPGLGAIQQQACAGGGIGHQLRVLTALATVKLAS